MTGGEWACVALLAFLINRACAALDYWADR